MHRISIIVPVYNAESYLHQCIDSILAQTYADFELLLVDDGSTDHSADICDEYAAFDKRIRVLRQKNSGQAAARNLGIKNSTGEWITFVDSDDIIHPQMLAILSVGIEKHRGRIAVCNAYEAVNIPDSFYTELQPSFTELYMNEDGLISARKRNYAFWVVWGKIIHRSIVEKLPFTDGRIYEDNAVVPQWLYEAEKIVVTDEKLYYYRINPDGTTKKAFSPKKLDYLWALECQLSFFKEKKMRKLHEMTAKQYIMELSQFAKKHTAGAISDEIYHALRDKYISFRRAEGKGVHLNKREREQLLSVFYPRLNKAHDLLCASSRAIRNDGVAGFIKKTSGYIGRKSK